MNTRLKNILMAFVVSVSFVGCGVGGDDPLLYDESGDLRAQVHSYELEEAGIETCGELEREIVSLEEVVQVPVIDAEGPVVLLGVGGLALCVSEGGANDAGLEVEEQSKPDSEKGEDESDGELLTVGERPPTAHSQPNSGRPPQLVLDPTPEPAND